MVTNQFVAGNKKNEWKKFVTPALKKISWQCSSYNYIFTGGKTCFEMHILGPRLGQQKQVKKCPMPDEEAVEFCNKTIPLRERDDTLIGIPSEPINVE
mmetsp:Transcript_1449/g.1984  ORF Transcript_1449/g.1984 Transcript_1449/m.1984 type:complete len:98 (-) Transcript_1449:310-603(-)